ncbi:MAG: ribosome recycling factor [Gammaproteobacteria bacterium]|nr:ribosome recycling factor [Gammaproteobacteria bacterium]MCW5583210.1 ribosome recycling factor [Gammaproteobacteria bacterium]
MHKIVKDAEARMRKSIDSYKAEIAKLRTGRAHPGILEHIRIDYYGNEMPLNQVANVNATDARTLTIIPWEKNMVPVIEKAILNSDLGLNPATAGTVIRVPMPPLNEERRKELIKVVRNEAEAARVSIRNLRRDANAELKELLKSKEITEDEERRLMDAVQKITDKFVAEIDQLTAAKESDLMAI